MTVILVTGASGFVGLNLTRRLAQEDVKIIALARRAPDDDTRRFLGNVATRIKWVPGDVQDRDGLIRLAEQHHVTHFIQNAAITPSLSEERAHTARIFEVNLGGTLNVLEAARTVTAQRVVLVSSTALYSGVTQPHRRIMETEPPHIESMYSICKAASEQLCQRYTMLHGLSTAAGRLGSAYGPMERTTQSRNKMSLMYQLMHHALAGDSIRVYGETRLRDFCYIDDVTEAFTRLTLADHLHWPVYNVGPETPLRVADALNVAQQLNPAFTWTRTDDPTTADIVTQPHQSRSPHDISRLREDVGYAPAYSLTAGLSAYWTWLQDGWTHL